MVQLIFEFFVRPIKTHYILLKTTSPKLLQQSMIFQLDTLQWLKYQKYIVDFLKNLQESPIGDGLSDLNVTDLINFISKHSIYFKFNMIYFEKNVFLQIHILFFNSKIYKNNINKRVARKYQWYSNKK